MSRLGQLLNVIEKNSDKEDLENFVLLWEMFEEHGGEVRHINEMLKSELEDMGVEL